MTAGTASSPQRTSPLTIASGPGVGTVVRGGFGLSGTNGVCAADVRSGTSFRVIVPVSGWVNPAIIEISVVLPAPE